MAKTHSFAVTGPDLLDRRRLANGEAAIAAKRSPCLSPHGFELG